MRRMITLSRAKKESVRATDIESYLSKPVISMLTFVDILSPGGGGSLLTKANIFFFAGLEVRKAKV